MKLTIIVGCVRMLLISLLGYFFYVYTKLVFWLSVVEIVNEGVLEELKGGHNGAIFTFWNHSHFLLLSHYKHCCATYLNRKEILVLVGRTWKGQVLSCVIHRLGAKTVEISNRDAVTRGIGIKNVLRLAGPNSSIAIVADGPKGPAFEVKPGVSYLSRKTMRNIVPVWASCRWKIRCSRWDGYMVPLPIPFNAVKIVIGEPISFNSYSLSQIEKLREIETALNRLPFIMSP